MTPSFVTIIPRGRAGGFTRFDEPDGVHTSRRALTNRLVVTMGGRAAELRQFGEDGLTSGSSGDLHHATGIAREMVLHYGMGAASGLIYADEPTKKLDAEVGHLLDEALAAAMSILESSEGAEVADAIAGSLLEKESLGSEDLRKILQRAGAVKTAA
jgi:cell division protease FtsH